MKFKVFFVTMVAILGMVSGRFYSHPPPLNRCEMCKMITSEECEKLPERVQSQCEDICVKIHECPTTKNYLLSFLG